MLKIFRLIVVLACVAKFANGQTIPIVSSVQYNSVLDAIFPWPTYTANNTQYMYAMRFLPSSHAEGQVLVEVGDDGHVQMWLYTVQGRSAWQQANQCLKEHHTLDAFAVAKGVNVIKREIPLPHNVASSWHAAFFESLKVSSDQLKDVSTSLEAKKEVTIVLDGSTYDLRYWQGDVELRWHLMDEEVDDETPTGRSDLARWMNTVRRYALHHEQ